MKKIAIIILFVIFSAAAGIIFYLNFFRLNMNDTTKIICGYFDKTEMILKDDNTGDVNINFIDYSASDEADILQECIDYEGSMFRFSGRSVNKNGVKTDKKMAENIYELEGISLKYGLAYENEGEYFLYFCSDNLINDSSRMENFDRLLSEINVNGKLCFYSLQISISTYIGNNSTNKEMKCEGDIDKLFYEYIMGNKMKNVGFYSGERVTTTRKSHFKTAEILMLGYMQEHF